jgi:hypothetical protein
MKLGTKVSLGLISSVLALGMVSAADNDGMAGGQKHDMNCDSKDMVKGQMKMDPVARAKQHLSELKAKLNLTKEQEPDLQTFSDQINEQAKTMMSMQDKMKGVMPKTAPEHMAMMADKTKSKAQNMSAMADTVKTFYSTLSPDQQATFDKVHMSAMHE